jgi:hypothetical protein
VKAPKLYRNSRLLRIAWRWNPTSVAAGFSSLLKIREKSSQFRVAVNSRDKDPTRSTRPPRSLLGSRSSAITSQCLSSAEVSRSLVSAPRILARTTGKILPTGGPETSGSGAKQDKRGGVKLACPVRNSYALGSGFYKCFQQLRNGLQTAT